MGARPAGSATTCTRRPAAAARGLGRRTERSRRLPAREWQRAGHAAEQQFTAQRTTRRPAGSDAAPWRVGARRALSAAARPAASAQQLAVPRQWRRANPRWAATAASATAASATTLAAATAAAAAARAALSAAAREQRRRRRRRRRTFDELPGRRDHRRRRHERPAAAGAFIRPTARAAIAAAAPRAGSTATVARRCASCVSFVGRAAEWWTVAGGWRAADCASI